MIESLIYSAFTLLVTLAFILLTGLLGMLIYVLIRLKVKGKGHEIKIEDLKDWLEDNGA